MNPPPHRPQRTRTRPPPQRTTTPLSHTKPHALRYPTHSTTPTTTSLHTWSRPKSPLTRPLPSTTHMTPKPLHHNPTVMTPAPPQLPNVYCAPHLHVCFHIYLYLTTNGSEIAVSFTRLSSIRPLSTPLSQPPSTTECSSALSQIFRDVPRLPR